MASRLHKPTQPPAGRKKVKSRPQMAQTPAKIRKSRKNGSGRLLVDIGQLSNWSIFGQFEVVFGPKNGS